MKQKTHSGAKKRFIKKKSGKIKFFQSGKRHILTKKSSKSKRHMRFSSYINGSDLSHIKSVL